MDVLVSDGEPGLTNAVEASRRQLCILHAVRYLLFTSWREGMSPVERHEADEAVRHALFPLVYSARRHLEEEDGERLRSKIDETLEELREVAHGLRAGGYPKAAGFLERNVRFMVTFAELALEGVEMPYTTNRIERMMSETSKRCKHRWMHWSKDGLRNRLTLSSYGTPTRLYTRDSRTLISVMRYSSDVRSRILPCNRTAQSN